MMPAKTTRVMGTVMLLLGFEQGVAAQQNLAVIFDIRKPPTGATSYADQEPVENVDVFVARERRWQTGWKRLPLDVLDRVNIRRAAEPRVQKLIITFADPRRKQVVLTEGDHIQIVDLETIRIEGGFFGWIVGRIRTTTRYIQAIASGTQYGVIVDGERTRLYVWEGAVEVSTPAGARVVVREKYLTETIGQGAPAPPRIPRFEEIKDLVLFGIEVDPDVRTRFADERSQAELHEDLIRAEFESAIRPTVETQINLGNLYLTLGRLDQALAVFNRAEKISPVGDLYNGRGIIYALRPGLGDPVSEFRAAIARDDLSRFHNNLGVYYLRERLVDRALAEFQTAIRREPTNHVPYNGLGVAWLHSGQGSAALARAEAAFRRAIRLKPKPAALTNLGTTYLLQGNLDAAEESYRQAQRLAGLDAAIANNLGVAHLRRGRYEEALAEFLKAIHADRSDPAAYCNLALVYHAQQPWRETITRRVQNLSAPGGPVPAQLIRSFLAFLDEVARIPGDQFAAACERFAATVRP
jgi:Flp pilus assembly protein TadD